MLAEYLVIGEVLKPQGLRGEVKVRPITHDINRFRDIGQVYLGQDGDLQPRKVHCERIHDGFVYLRFDGVEDRDAAEALRGALLQVPRKDALQLPEDMHFICDLVGCSVVDTEGEAVGVLKDVLTPGSNDVYVLDTPAGEILLPALYSVVLDIDVETGRIIVDRERMQEVAVFPDQAK